MSSFFSDSTARRRAKKKKRKNICRNRRTNSRTGIILLNRRTVLPIGGRLASPVIRDITWISSLTGIVRSLCEYHPAFSKTESFSSSKNIRFQISRNHALLPYSLFSLNTRVRLRFRVIRHILRVRL